MAGREVIRSSKELLKLLTEVSSLNIEISHIISLSGINDIEGYSNPNINEYLHGPYLDSNQIYMLQNQKWIIQKSKTLNDFSKHVVSSIILILIYHIQKKINLYLDIILNHDFKDNADVWLFNIKAMHAISLILGAEFFCFLQPTLGLEGAQSNFIGQNSRDEELLLDLLKMKPI